MIAIFLLAAGAGQRMRHRGDKLLCPVRWRSRLHPLLRVRAHICSSLVVPFLPQVILPPRVGLSAVCAHQRQAALRGVGVGVIHTSVDCAQNGLSASIRTAVLHTPPLAQAIMLLFADMPDITRSDICALYNRFHLEKSKIVRATAHLTHNQQKQGHPVIFHRALFPDLLALVGDRGAYALCQRYQHETLYVALAGKRAIMDLDNVQDWQKWWAQQKPIPV